MQAIWQPDLLPPIDELETRAVLKKLPSAHSALAELYPNQTEQFIIPDLPTKDQTDIADQVQRSFTLRTESETLLARAKQAVEIAIEQGEAAGLAFLKTVPPATT
jgi:hypothetical protein